MSSASKIFISYASEDKQFAYWLDLKLRSLGYDTWIDREKLLGGESFVSDIDQAIKSLTFCFISIISKASVGKDAPRRERTLAGSIEKQLGRTFLIPVKIDKFTTNELPWDISDRSLISFLEGWAEGLAKLLKKLESLNTPTKNPPLLALATEIESVYSPTNIFRQAWSNIFRFIETPQHLVNFKTVSNFNTSIIPSNFPYIRINDNSFFSFDSPILDNQPGIFDNKLGDIHSDKKIFKWLLSKTIRLHAMNKGMQQKPDSKKELFLPEGITEKNKIRFLVPGKARSILITHSSFRTINKN